MGGQGSICRPPGAIVPPDGSTRNLARIAPAPCPPILLADGSRRTGTQANTEPGQRPSLEAQLLARDIRATCEAQRQLKSIPRHDPCLGKRYRRRDQEVRTPASHARRSASPQGQSTLRRPATTNDRPHASPPPILSRPPPTSARTGGTRHLEGSVPARPARRPSLALCRSFLRSSEVPENRVPHSIQRQSPQRRTD
mgnify:CR=1 FL=1